MCYGPTRGKIRATFLSALHFLPNPDLTFVMWTVSGEMEFLFFNGVSWVVSTLVLTSTRCQSSSHRLLEVEVPRSVIPKDRITNVSSVNNMYHIVTGSRIASLLLPSKLNKGRQCAMEEFLLGCLSSVLAYFYGSTIRAEKSGYCFFSFVLR